VLSEFDYLVATGDSRVGALAFGTDLSGPRRIVPWAKQKEPRMMKPARTSISQDDEAVRELNTARTCP